MVKILLLVTLFLVTAKSKAALVCPDGWKEFDNSCYKVMKNYLHSSTIDWLRALRLCLGMGGNLVSIANEEEMEFVKNLSPTLNNHPAWIGLVYSSSNGKYVWSDNTPVNSSVHANWLLEDPVNKTGNILCADLWKSGLNFTRCGCNENQLYICKRPKGPKPCSDDWIFDGSSCYKASKEIKEWNDALDSCLSLGGYLVEIDGAHEQQFIADYMNMSGFSEQNFVSEDNKYKGTIVRGWEHKMENKGSFLGERTTHGVPFNGVPLDYLKWTTLKNDLGVNENDFSRIESHLNVRSLPRTFISLTLGLFGGDPKSRKSGKDIKS